MDELVALAFADLDVDDVLLDFAALRVLLDFAALFELLDLAELPALLDLAELPDFDELEDDAFADFEAFAVEPAPDWVDDSFAFWLLGELPFDAALDALCSSEVLD